MVAAIRSGRKTVEVESTCLDVEVKRTVAHAHPNESQIRPECTR